MSEAEKIAVNFGDNWLKWMGATLAGLVGIAALVAPIVVVARGQSSMQATMDGENKAQAEFRAAFVSWQKDIDARVSDHAKWIAGANETLKSFVLRTDYERELAKSTSQREFLIKATEQASEILRNQTELLFKIDARIGRIEELVKKP